jgi:23S rRNA (uridine2552-2'-O)-methyltransferase
MARSKSSKAWMREHVSDQFVKRAGAEGYRSRAAYKLQQIAQKDGLLKPGMVVVDLGAAPGGWSQIVAERVGSREDEPRVVAVDTLPMEPLPGVAILQLDFLDEAAPAAILEALGGPPDVVLSDMAAPTTGHRSTDHLRTMALCEAAADFAREALAPGGRFLAKVFRGGTEHTLLAELKRDFARIHHVKPPASRAESPELYLLATEFRGKAPGNR